MKGCLRCVWSFVPPARSEYSPPEREVGMEMIGTVADLFWEVGRSFLETAPVVSVARESKVDALFARAWYWSAS